MTVKIDHKSGSDPRPLADKLVAGQAYPFVAVFKHGHSKALVVPSSGIDSLIEPKTETKVKVKNYGQAWLLVTDLAELARRAGNDSSDFAELTAPAAVVGTPALEVQPTEGKAPAAAPAQSESKAPKPKAQGGN